MGNELSRSVTILLLDVGLGSPPHLRSVFRAQFPRHIEVTARIGRLAMGEDDRILGVEPGWTYYKPNHSRNFTHPAHTDNFTLDAHDLAAIVLDTHARIDPPFRTSTLIEVNKGDAPIRVFPEGGNEVSVWRQSQGMQRVAYIHDHDCGNSQDIVTIDNYVSREIVTPGGVPLSRCEAEDAFWRCKTFNNGYLLSDTVERVLASLPRTTKLRLRISRGHEVICAPHDVRILETVIAPHASCLLFEPEGQYASGFGDGIPWPPLLLGPSTASDEERAILDLAITQIGGRGSGGELFAVERVQDYKEKLLPKYMTHDGEGDRETYAFHPFSKSPAQMVLREGRREDALPEVQEGAFMFFVL
ncbi:hypothetical protein C8Q80DRAFT_1116415 [Daedaleopsis nitida]|nr:hypothetical protein C8Q80DRAFT_1116415 [Daedaleopsis nitida]